MNNPRCGTLNPETRTPCVRTPGHDGPHDFAARTPEPDLSAVLVRGQDRAVWIGDDVVQALADAGCEAASGRVATLAAEIEVILRTVEDTGMWSERAPSDMSAYLASTIGKYRRWCGDDKIRGKYGDPRKVRDHILEDTTGVLAKLRANGG